MNSISKSGSMDTHSTRIKSQIRWTKGLRKRFLDAVEKLGIDNAVPMKILELMKVDGLTRDHVSSYLQKYRTVLKKISNDNYSVQTASKPNLLESSMANYTSWNNSSLIFNQEQMHMPNYSGTYTTNPQYPNTSSSHFLELSGSSPTEGYFMQEMGNNLYDQQRNNIYDTASMGVLNSINTSNYGFVPYIDGFLYNVGGFSTEVPPYNNIEMDSSTCVNTNNAPIYVENLSNNSYFVDNSNGFEIKYSGHNDFGEMGSMYGSDLNREYAIAEDDLEMTEADIACLLSFADDYRVYGRTSNNLPVTLDAPDQDVNRQKFHDIASFASNKNEDSPSINQHQILYGYLPGFYPTYN